MATRERSRERPLSPHLQVYSWQVQMVTSILHRATGVILVVGSLLVVWALLALAGGPQPWAEFSRCARSPLGFLVLFGWSWALAFHLINGARHLLQDAGYGLGVEDFVRSSWISIIGSVVMVVLVWAIVLQQWGQA